ncbi:MAG: ABC transporter permease [Clostridiales bacterium]|nr:ABC transporter permease [Clostridiales bacterium]
MSVSENHFENLPKKSVSVIDTIKKIVQKQVFIPLAALLVLILFNLIADPSFFKISLDKSSSGDPVLSGYLITILDNASELAILAIGMTLVTSASGGQDISVGATVAIAGSVVLKVLCGSQSRPDQMQAPIIVAFLICLVVSMLFGAFNGMVVSFFKIQPMVATLILFTAGRSIAAWINNNELPVISDPKFGYYGNFIPGIPVPTPIFIAAICMIIIALVLKFTNLRLYSQAVGINPSSSRLNGINPQLVKFLTFVILGACVAVAGFIKVSRLSTINYSVVAKDIEMDVILAVALGGNQLSGGKFSMTSSILGAYVIQFLTTTLFKFKVSSSAIAAYKAVVVIVLVVLSAPIVREKMVQMKKKGTAAKVGKAKKEVA